MSAKDIFIKLIDKKSADKVVKKYHYSGKVTQNSQLSFGIFKDDCLLGAAQFGPSIDKRRMGQSLGIGMNESLELNRLAISDELGKNTESRALSVCIKLIKKKYPHIRAIISFADACQCGDGTIYKASGFKLHSYKKNNSLMTAPEGGVYFNHGTKKNKVIAKKTMDAKVGPDGRYMPASLKEQGYKPIEGFQMKYIYCIDKTLLSKYNWVPFNKIPDNIKMYKGIKRSELESKASSFQLEESGAIPTAALHSKRAENGTT